VYMEVKCTGICGDQLTFFDRPNAIIVCYCAVDISDYIVLFYCKVCSIVIFSGVKLSA